MYLWVPKSISIGKKIRFANTGKSRLLAIPIPIHIFKKYGNTLPILRSSSAIVERPRCRMG